MQINNKRNWHRLIAIGLVVAAGVSHPTWASEQTARVANVMGDNFGGPFAFGLLGSRTGKPSCAADDTWAIQNPASDNAKGLLSLVMTALGAGRTVYVHGTGDCATPSPSRESVAWIVIY